jgi:TonB family protein
MTVRQAYYISIAAHIMVFGSALAIAQHGRGLFLSSVDTITVALVSPGPTSGDGRGAQAGHMRTAAPIRNEGGEVKNEAPAEPIRNQVKAAKNEVSAETIMSQVTTVKNEITSDRHAGPETTSMPLSGQITRNEDFGKGSPGSAPATSGSGEVMSAQSGGISSEEWANLAAAIERTKNYPRLARERGIEGVVRLRFRLTSSGTVEKIEVVHSSGSEILDNASIGAVYRAAPLPYVSGWVDMPMKYELK